jgi:hypothetical protein
MNTLLKYLKVFAILIASFFAFSVLVCLLPNQSIKKNIAKSVPDMVTDGCYHYGMINKRQFFMDNFTDAILLSQNYTLDKNQPVTSAMYVRRATTYTNTVEALDRQVNSDDGFQLVPYPRYWHGNSFLLRLFLLFSDYSFIRWLLYVISSILFLILGVKLFQTVGMRKTVAFVVGLLCVNIFITQFSMQFFTVVALALIASILMCKYYKNRKKVLLVSFIFGCLTSYFDLLTAPLLTCGLPLIVYLSAENEDPFKKRFFSLFLFALLWGLGYGLTWASKWTLGTIFTDINVYKDAFETTLYRTNTEYFSRLEAIHRNFKLLPTGFIYLISISLLLLALVFFNKKESKTNLLLFIVATFPFLWFLVVAQHSGWHPWFTYRILAISVISLWFILINFISWDKIRDIKSSIFH